MILGNAKSDVTLITTAIQCLTDLMVSASHFNEHRNILAMVVSQIGRKDIAQV